jgi:hypothetical protein
MTGTLLGMVSGVSLPWLAGAALLALAGTRSDRYNPWLILGYGLPLGVLITTVLMRASSVLLSEFSFALIAGVLVLLALMAIVMYVRRERAPLIRRVSGIDWLLVVLLALIVFRFGHLVVGAAVQPLVGADTWWFWASKARVWYETGHMATFVEFPQWVAADHAGAMVYADPKPHYPALVSLSKTWIALALGRWDEALTNALWPALFAALLFAFYGQLRLVAGQRYCLLFTALLAGIPLLNMNVFGAGLADLFVSVGFGFAAMALYQYARSGDRWQWLLFGIGAIFCLGSKDIGILLALCLVPGVALIVLPRRVWWALMGLAAALAAGVWLAILFLDFSLFGMDEEMLQLGFRPDAVISFLQRMFAEEGWHLLWYALPAGVFAALWRRSMDLAAMSVLLPLVCAVSLLAVIFTASVFAVRGGQDAIPRHLLHLAPAALFLCAVIWSRLFGEAVYLGAQRGNAH